MNHKVYIRSIACQTRYIPPQPHIIPALIGAGLIGAGVSVAQGIAGAFQNNKNLKEQERINQENLDFQREMFAKKSAREDLLNANSALIQRQSLEKAGLNPNIGSYGQLQTNVTQGSPSSQAYAGQNPLAGIDGGALASLIQQQPLVNAQSRLTNAEAKKQEIENRRMTSEDAQYSVEEALAYLRDNPKAPLPEIEVVPKNRGWFDAKRNYNALRGEEGDTMVKRVDGFIKNAQYLDEDVRNAIIKLPINVRNKVIDEAKLAVAKASESDANKAYIDAQKSYTELKEQLERDNNIMPYIDKIFMGDFGFDDFCKLMVLGVIAAKR